MKSAKQLGNSSVTWGIHGSLISLPGFCSVYDENGYHVLDKKDNPEGISIELKTWMKNRSILVRKNHE